MKTTAHYLKIFCFLVLPILSYACPALAVGSGNENEAVAGENKALKEKMVRFFLNYLSGDETLYQDNKPVSLADIARQRQLVWDAKIFGIQIKAQVFVKTEPFFMNQRRMHDQTGTTLDRKSSYKALSQQNYPQ